MINVVSKEYFEKTGNNWERLTDYTSTDKEYITAFLLDDLIQGKRFNYVSKIKTVNNYNGTLTITFYLKTEKNCKPKKRVYTVKQ